MIRGHRSVYVDSDDPLSVILEAAIRLVWLVVRGVLALALGGCTQPPTRVDGSGRRSSDMGVWRSHRDWSTNDRAPRPDRVAALVPSDVRPARGTSTHAALACADVSR